MWVCDRNIWRWNWCATIGTRLETGSELVFRPIGLNSTELIVEILNLIVETDATDRQEEETLLSQRGRAMLYVCIASIQNVERSFIINVKKTSTEV